MIREDAVSEVIGSILLISLVGIAVAIIAIMFLSQPVPVEIQSLNVIASYKDDDDLLLLYHDGGDAMVKGEYRIRILPSGAVPNIPKDMWVIGEYLPFTDVQSKPDRIQIISTRGGQDTLIKEITIGTFVTPGPITPSPRPPVCVDCDNLYGNCSEADISDAYLDIAMNTSYIFQRVDSKTALSASGRLYFEVMDQGSKLFRSGVISPIDLHPGDIVTITLRSNSKDFRIFGLGDRFFHLQGKGVDLEISNTTNPITASNIELYNGWITGYHDLGSSFSIESPKPTGSSGAYTLLVINGTVIINDFNTDPITFSNIHPIGVGLFLLEDDSNSQDGVFFIGNAASYSVG
ncbi:hypothetical protein ASZ90_015722 [hydrocarbon metagenome]|uniref:Archaeal Type IV pilin N-terminal domain-containing protein n=1 Tax=hydrocarbon metagenome TaxID=938273 RepID=A0A0W8F1B7_9ZZZZ